MISSGGKSRKVKLKGPKRKQFMFANGSEDIAAKCKDNARLKGPCEQVHMLRIAVSRDYDRRHFVNVDASVHAITAGVSYVNVLHISAECEQVHMLQIAAPCD